MAVSDNKPKYWQTIDEREDHASFLEEARKEFGAPPVKESEKGIDRRGFLKLMGASTVMAALACTRRPVEKIIPFVNRPEDVTPGIAQHYATSCQGCVAGCGVVAKVREGRPIKLEGNPQHPVNQGALCANGQASLLDLYDPDRLTESVALNDGKGSAVAFDQIDQKVKEVIKKAKASGKKVVLLTDGSLGPTGLELAKNFGAEHLAYDPIFPDAVVQAQELSYGQKLLPRYWIDKAEQVVSFGADFLASWISPVEFSKRFRKVRNPEEKKFASLTCFESALSLTGSNADRYHNVPSGFEAEAALALAYEVLHQDKNNGRFDWSVYLADSAPAFSNKASLLSALANFNPKKVGPKLGLDPLVWQNLAKELLSRPGKSLVLGGATHVKDSVLLELAVNLINSVLGNDGLTVDWSFSPRKANFTGYQGLKKLADQMAQGQVSVLITAGVNPAFDWPKELGFAEALQKVDLFVAHAMSLDESARLARYAIATPHYLEAWSDAESYQGVFSVIQPTIRPLYQTRSLLGSLARWSGSSKEDYQLVREFWQKNIFSKAGSGSSFDRFWRETLKKGICDLRSGDEKQFALAVTGARSFKNETFLSRLKKVNASSVLEGLSLNFVVSPVTRSGKRANNSWLNELPDPITKQTWGHALWVAPQTAKEYRLMDGDVVKIAGEGLDFQASIVRQPKMAKNHLALAVGYGRKQAGRVADQIQKDQVNLFDLTKIVGGLATWSGHAVTLEKTGRRERLAVAQAYTSDLKGALKANVDHRLEEIVRDTSYAEYLKNPKAGNEHPHYNPVTIWDEHSYEGKHKWGMAIDMTTCTGCSACVVACQAENNIPSVGPEQVALGREMQWMRIDRFYKGDDDNPEIVFQPMLCQHCENAPCETVCPVLATVHNDDGLNVMVYNRCVGTRYCANNCPYKVRRFNYFGYDESISEPYRKVLNPDLSVRSQGVMEKCTFCIQRIRQAKDLAKDEGRRVKDGEVQTACQQGCPSDAISFGDLNDRSSRVFQVVYGKKQMHSKGEPKKLADRGYHVLGELNVRPRITYLTKIRDA